MKVRQHLRRGSVICLAAVLMVSAAGCGSHQADSSEASSTETTEAASVRTTESDYVASGVTLPDNFEHMIYPMEAVMVDHYAQGYSYYKSGDDSKSFWCSMAVLSSLLSGDECVDPLISEDYSFYTDDQIDAFASALYSDFADGKMVIADLDDDDPYATYDDDLQEYGMLNGNVGNLSIYVTSCTPSATGYVIGADLVDLQTEDTLEEFMFTLKAQKEAAEGDLFAYSISDIKLMSDAQADDSPESSTSSLPGSSDKDQSGDEPTVENDFDEVDGVEITDDDFDTDQKITKEEALSMAKNYMGEDYKYTYKQMISIGDYDYYDFKIIGGDTGMTDVLVSTNGGDVVSGIKNDDGSWSFDQ